METSGFFQAMIDESTGDYDRKYLAREFANYFALFIKNGVFGSPTNQLRVTPGNGLSISVAPGNAFIKGMWYNNSSLKNIVLVPNYSSSDRIDTVRVRMSEVTRTIIADVYTGDAELVRGEDVFDLQIAAVTVKPGAESITAAEIQDTRPNESVCGFVTQLLRVETTSDLFAQFQAQFDQWFEKIQEKLDENTAGNLQNQINSIEADLIILQNKFDIDVINLKEVKARSVPRWIIEAKSGSASIVSGRHPIFSVPQGDFVNGYLFINMYWAENNTTGSQSGLHSISGIIRHQSNFSTEGKMEFWKENTSGNSWTSLIHVYRIWSWYQGATFEVSVCYRQELKPDGTLGTGSTSSSVTEELGKYCLPVRFEIFATEDVPNVVINDTENYLFRTK